MFTKPTRRRLRTIIVATLGGALLVVGMACLVLPIPATPIIITALVLLATEFDWSHKLLLKIPPLFNKLRGKRPHAKTTAYVKTKELIGKVRKIVPKGE